MEAMDGVALDAAHALTAQALDELPPSVLVQLWSRVTESVARRACDGGEALGWAPDEAAPSTFDDRADALRQEQRRLEDAAEQVLRITRTADAVLHAVAEAHDAVVVERDHLEAAHSPDETWRPYAGEFGRDAFAMALGVSSACAERYVLDARTVRRWTPQLWRLAQAGGTRMSVASVVAHELDHLDEQEAHEAEALLLADGIQRLGVTAARRRVRKLLRSLGLSRLEVQELSPRREMGVWFSENLDFDNLTDMHVTLEAHEAARLQVAIDERAAFLLTHAPHPEDVHGSRRYDALGAARVDALMDLVMSNAQVTTMLHLQVPVVHNGAEGDSVAVAGIEGSPGPGGVSGASGAASAGVTQLGIGPAAWEISDAEGFKRRRWPSESGDVRLGEPPLTRRPTQTAGCDGMRHVRVTCGSAVIPGIGTIPADVVTGLQHAVGTQFVVSLGRMTRSGRFVTIATSTTTYRPTSALAKLVRRRDQTCRFPHCTRTAQRCDVDHVLPYSDGGATTASNLQSLCRHHHRAKTFGGFVVVMDADGVCLWESPTGHRWETHPGGVTLEPPGVGLATPDACGLSA